MKLSGWKGNDMTRLGMNHRTATIRRWSLGVLTLLVWGSGMSAQAQESNFGSFTLNPKTLSHVTNGSTGGTTSLPAVTANTDRNDNQCLGFGDPKPDHVMKLTRRLDRLKLQVDSGGRDTTLIIMGPNGEWRCTDDFGNGKDAGIDDGDWQPGNYKVWIGSVTPGKRWDYRLVVQGF
jgi:hypothetical protein